MRRKVCIPPCARDTPFHSGVRYMRMGLRESIHPWTSPVRVSAEPCGKLFGNVQEMHANSNSRTTVIHVTVIHVTTVIHVRMYFRRYAPVDLCIDRQFRDPVVLTE